MAWAGNKSEQSLEEVYRKSCSQSGSGFDSIFVEEDEIDDYAEFDLKNQGGHDVAHEVLQQVQHETVFVDPDIEQKENLIGPPEYEDADLHEVLKSAPDEDPEKNAVSQAGEIMPTTLQEAMNSRGCTWNALFRFVVRLRSAKGGSDSRWIKNPRRSRRSSATLNWHQCLGSMVDQWKLRI